MMPDDLDTLTDRLASDLAAVRWPDAAQIRARARRRTRRTVLAVPVAVMLVLVGSWGVFSGLGDDRSGPAVQASEPSVGSITASGSPDAGPTASSGPPARTSTDVGPADAAWIPAGALLQPEDVGGANHLENEYTYQPATYPTWTFALGCTGFEGLHITAYQRYQFMRGHTVAPNGSTEPPIGWVFVEAQRYTATDAVQVMSDIRRAVQTCARYTGSTEASSDAHPAHAVTEWSITGSDFAGDQSLLIRQRVTSVEDRTGQQVGNALVENYVAIRVGNLVTILQISGENPTKLKALGAKAAQRLCVAAVPRC